MDHKQAVVAEEAKQETVREIVKRTAATLSEALVALRELEGPACEEERKEPSIHSIIDELEVDALEAARLARDVRLAVVNVARRL
jgi:hypothetical protein